MGGESSPYIFKLSKIKEHLYDLLAKIATNKQPLAQKKQLLQSVKLAFGFEAD